MPGLLSDVLPFVYSQGNRAKRYIGGLLSDPVAELQQTAGKAVDDLNAVGRLTNQAIDPRNPAKIVNRQAFNQLAEQYMNSMLNFAPVGATVWHGSPHKFDKFDSSKIGTGEGAQAYGHGIYAAESPDVASAYRASVSAEKGNQFGLDDGPIKGIATLIAARGDAGEQLARKAYASSVKDIDLAVKQARDAVNRGSYLYKVDLPDEAIAKMLDWDKPLSQQAPEVRAALNSPKVSEMVGRLKSSGQLGDYSAAELQRLSGSDWHDMIRQANADSNVAPSEFLRQAGIPGIRYLDGGSRGTGAGTSNFVVFPGNENLLTILERNGKPLGLLGD